MERKTKTHEKKVQKNKEQPPNDRLNKWKNILFNSICYEKRLSSKNLLPTREQHELFCTHIECVITNTKQSVASKQHMLEIF